MFRSRLLACLCLLAFGLSQAAARADEAADKAAVAARLRGFADAFNARDEARSCDIFAPDLIATAPPRLETGRAAICGNIDRLLARPDLRLHYDDPDIREIIVAGDIAVVRVLWTLTVRKGGAQDRTPEGGIDVFRRQPDGRWSIARMAAFTLRPNKLLD
ncbi:nuclear transport factor 2 family protein [uncultured Rhodoblastus sp.]|uniref:YybH family protein n=1 Tax=uncultured Rhodoblastus sp. TaxID=543037 RepID=UPI0025E8AB47|nr:nuclear transport factor 2 family protein [uncultured Rhodoblastus sp.]